jgi:DNA-directed RNA polymerase beta subunit
MFHSLLGSTVRRVCGCRYAAPLYIDIEQTVRVKDGDGEVLEENVEKYDKIFMGEVPIMLRSSYCSLADRSNRELTTLGECPYDQASNTFLTADNPARRAASSCCARCNVCV